MHSGKYQTRIFNSNYFQNFTVRVTPLHTVRLNLGAVSLTQMQHESGTSGSFQVTIMVPHIIVIEIMHLVDSTSEYTFLMMRS
jgi:hypothetical protein